MKAVIAITLLLTCQLCFGQNFPTYQSDGRYHGHADFMGVTLTPSRTQEAGRQFDSDIEPGDVTFSMNNQYFTYRNGSEQRKYTLSSFTKSKYGFVGKLMDIRNPTNNGQIKYIVTPDYTLEACIFRSDNGAKETIYFFEEKDNALMIKERDFFTVKDSMALAAPFDQGIWNQKIAPFFELSSHKRRLYLEENVFFEFNRDTTSTEETKKGPKYTFSDEVKFSYNYEGGDKGETTYKVTKTKGKEVKGGGPAYVLTLSLEDENLQKQELFVALSSKGIIQGIDINNRRYLLRDTKQMPIKEIIEVKAGEPAPVEEAAPQKSNSRFWWD